MKYVFLSDPKPSIRTFDVSKSVLIMGLEGFVALTVSIKFGLSLNSAPEQNTSYSNIVISSPPKWSGGYSINDILNPSVRVTLLNSSGFPGWLGQPVINIL